MNLTKDILREVIGTMTITEAGEIVDRWARHNDVDDTDRDRIFRHLHQFCRGEELVEILKFDPVAGEDWVDNFGNVWTIKSINVGEREIRAVNPSRYDDGPGGVVYFNADTLKAIDNRSLRLVKCLS